MLMMLVHVSRNNSGGFDAPHGSSVDAWGGDTREDRSGEDPLDWFEGSAESSSFITVVDLGLFVLH